MASKKGSKGAPKLKDGKTQAGSKNGKKADSGSSGSFFTWFIVLALLGVWTSVAVVYFDLVDYQGVLDKAKGLQINLSETLQGTPPIKDVGRKLRDALKQQLAIIHERVEAKKLAKLALAEVRRLLAKEQVEEEEEEKLDLGRKDMTARVKERISARLKEEEEKMEKEEMENALEKLRKEKAIQQDERNTKEGKDSEESKNRVENEEGAGRKAQEEKGRGRKSGKEKRKKTKDSGGKK